MYTLFFVLILLKIEIACSVDFNRVDLNIDGNNKTENVSNAQNMNLVSGCRGGLCIQKCCPLGQYVWTRKSCRAYNKTYDFSDVTIYDSNQVATGKSLKDTFGIQTGLFDHNEDFKNNSFDTTLLKFNAYLEKDGRLRLELPNAYDRWIVLNHTQFCVDYGLRLKDPSQIKPRFWVVIPPVEIAQSNIYLTGATLVSCVFLLLVLIVYALLPELRNLCGMILMAYVVSLFWAFLLLAIIQITSHEPNVCVGLTLSIYFFFLASFCWMNVMSYDIWWTFRGYAKARPIHRRGEHFKFLMYCLYAWGMPLAMTIGFGVLNDTDMTHLPWFVTPNVPRMGCFIEGGAKLLYLYVPMLILIICNWLFYLMTAYNVWRLGRGTAVLANSAASGTPSAHRTQRHRLMLYLKLSLVMGLNWLLEVVSFLWPDFKIWYITDLYNILLGFAIFLIFVCKRQILRKLDKRFHARRKTSWLPSSKSYSSSNSDSISNQETMTLQISANPRGTCERG